MDEVEQRPLPEVELDSLELPQKKKQLSVPHNMECTVCDHTDRIQIERALIENKWVVGNIAKNYGVRSKDLIRHRIFGHMEDMIGEAFGSSYRGVSAEYILSDLQLFSTTAYRSCLALQAKENHTGVISSLKLLTEHVALRLRIFERMFDKANESNFFAQKAFQLWREGLMEHLGKDKAALGLAMEYLMKNGLTEEEIEKAMPEEEAAIRLAMKGEKE